MAAIEHGTIRCYQRGCRRKKCRRAWADYVRSYRHGHKGVRSRAEALAARDRTVTSQLVARAVDEGRDVSLPVTLTGLGGQILVSLQEQNGKRRGEIIDDLLREKAEANAAA